MCEKREGRNKRGKEKEKKRDEAPT